MFNVFNVCSFCFEIKVNSMINFIDKFNNDMCWFLFKLIK